MGAITDRLIARPRAPTLRVAQVQSLYLKKTFHFTFWSTPGKFHSANQREMNGDAE